MKNLKPTFTLLLLTSLFIVISCSDGITPSTNESPTDPESTAASSVETKELTVMVHDRATLQPVEGVSVVSMPSRTKGITNKEGKHTFERPITDSWVVFNKKGYGEVQAPLKPHYEMLGAVFDKK